MAAFRSGSDVLQDHASSRTDELLIRVRKDRHRTEETLRLLRTAVGESADRGDSLPRTSTFTLSPSARCFLLASRLASLLVVAHVACFTLVHSLAHRSAILRYIAFHTSTGSQMLWRGEVCIAYSEEEKGASSSDGNGGLSSSSDAAAAASSSSQQRQLLIWARGPGLRLVWLLVTDVMFGVALMTVLWSNADQLAAWLVAQAEVTAVWLRALINWLMGVPAGLKLNNQLSEFLGRFFLYHIHLWSIYVRLVAPAVAPLLRAVAVCGALGGTLVLCLLADLLAAFTFHVYCFYVYAGRLFGAQAFVVKRLLRLFAGGRKWNVLRERVDSLPAASDRYLLGTLLFTVALWLLPTSSVFYAVFVGVRAASLAAACLLAWLVLLVNHLPVGDALLACCGLAELRLLAFELVPVAAVAAWEAESSSSYLNLKLNVRECGVAGGGERRTEKFFTVVTSCSDDGDGGGGGNADCAGRCLVACGRAAPLRAAFRGCPYGACSTQGFVPRLDAMAVLRSLTRGTIIHAPTRRLCRVAVDDRR